MKEGNFKKEAKLMLYFFLSILGMGFIAAYLGPHLMNRQKCLKYEPEVVRLNGMVKKVVFPGPPNYESIKSGDQPETYWVLYLTSGVCVKGNPKDDLNSETEQDVKEFQLIVGDYNRYRELLEKDVSVRGKLMHAHTGHHHTRVLIQMDDMTATHNSYKAPVRQGQK